MSAAIFKGAYVKLLAKAGIEFQEGTRMAVGSLDPITTAVDAPSGSIYVNNDNLGIFIKLDDGSSTNWKPMDVSAYTKEATGLADASQYTTNYDDATRTFSITPVGAYFDVIIKGRIFRFTSTQSVVHDNVAGEYFCEIDGTGAITASTTPFDFLERAQVRVARFDPVQTPTGWSLNENHGVTLDGAAHSILHATIGTRLISGGTITGGTITVRAPSDTYNAANSGLVDIQPGIDQTVLADEDIRTTLPALLEATGYSVMRKRWTANNYEWNVGQVAPFWRVLNVPQYNPSSGGDNWVAMTNNAYTCWYLVGIPAGIEADSQTLRYFWYNGGTQYVPTTASTANRTIALNNALAEDPGNINLTDLISTEYNIMHKLVVSYDTGSTGNDYRLRIEGSQSIRGNRSRPITTSGIVSTSHAALSDLSAPGAHPATSITASPTSFGLDPAVETDVELAIDRLSEFGYIGAWVTGKVYRVGNTVVDSGLAYRCNTAHTAGATFAGDVANWDIFALTTEGVQDITGAMMTDSTELDFTYDDGAGTVTAALKTTGVSAATYGSASAVPALVVDSKGRITSASSSAYQDASGSVAGIVSTGAQAFAGVKTFNSGIAFGNETLSAYDVGTWTPSLPNGGTVTVSGAKYIRIGNLITCTMFLTSVAPTNDGATFLITLPFTSSASSGIYFTGVIGFVNTTAGITNWRPLIPPGAASLYFEELGNSGVQTNAEYVALTGTKNLIITISYAID